MDYSIPPKGPWSNRNIFSKPDVTTTDKGGAWTTANSPITLFTVTGQVYLRVHGAFTTLMVSTANTGTLAVGFSGQTTLLLGTTTMNGTNGILNSVWTDTAPTVTAKAIATATELGFLVSNQNVILTIATNNMTAGGAILFCEWEPLSPGASITNL